MPTMTDRKNGRPVSVDDVMNEFREAYADAVNEWESREEWKALDARRQLTWKASRRIPLANAAQAYFQMAHGYNAFRPYMIPQLFSAFFTDKIQVTAAREYSVAIYLHIPEKPGLRERVEAFVNEHFEADIVEWSDPGTLRIWWD